jgi:paraquat-inducible protein B
MSEPPRTPDAPAAAEVEVRKRRGPSIVWLIPIVAALIGAGVAYRTISNKGPTISLTMKDGSGLEAGKTKIKYLDVEVGVVQTVALSVDGQSVVATAAMDKSTKQHLMEKTVFWKVSPRVSLRGISGLGTLVSGQYITMLPGPGKPARKFEVLESPPLSAEHRDALSIELVADKLGSIAVGSPVIFRGIEVGEVGKYDLENESRSFRIHVLIDRPYAKFVKKGTQFWDASGIDLNVGAGGVELRTASLASLVEGGVAFDTPPWAESTQVVEDGASFRLFESPEKAEQARERVEGLNISVEARDGSIAEGAPVYYRKHRVGHVGRSELSPDATSVRHQVHIDSRYAALVRTNSRFWNASGVKMHVGVDGLDLETDSVESILEGGLAFATPDRPGKRAESGALFALYEKPEKEWIAWAPKIWLGPEGEKRAVAHAILPATAKPRGLAIVLESFVSGSVKAGDAVYYREVKVGEVGEHELSDDAKTVRIHARIEPRYATLVRSNSRFWNASGIGVHFGLGGLDVQTESLESMLAGGVAFATPDRPGAPVEPGTIFPLHLKAEDEWKRWSPAIRIDAGRSTEPVEHAIQASTHPHLFPSAVKSEAVAPVRAGAPGAQPEAASPAADEPATKPGFLRRLFGGGDDGD